MEPSPLPLDPKEIDARLGEIEPEVAREVFVDLLNGEVSPALAVARLILALGRAGDVQELTAEVAHRWGRPLDPSLREMARLLHDHREGCERVAANLREHPDPMIAAASPEEAVAACRFFFDRAVRRSEEGSVAAYSLGDPGLLARATEEIVALFDRWGLLGSERRTLEIGCGIGRMQAALSPRVAEAWGIDVSPKMIEVARKRCEGFPNVRFSVCSGFDLAGLPDEGFDLVFAVDSFPYIHQAGRKVVEMHFQEAARVLRPEGDFVILNFSYRDDLAADRSEFRRLCRTAGFAPVVTGMEPFKLWDGVVFHGRKGEGTAS
jgi:SAM-dependent methyltransferase